MKYIFNKCFKLREIRGIKNFITNNIKYMNSMFQFCCELEYLNLFNFDTSNVFSMEYIFNECNKLNEIK